MKRLIDEKTIVSDIEQSDNGILVKKLDGESYEVEVSGGGGGTTDFNRLSNRPSYNGTTMTGTTNIPEVKTDTWDGKQDALTAGTRIDITDNTISVDISGLATSSDILAEAIDREQADNALSTRINAKQDTLTAGTNIHITDNTISADRSFGVFWYRNPITINPEQKLSCTFSELYIDETDPQVGDYIQGSYSYDGNSGVAYYLIGGVHQSACALIFITKTVSGNTYTAGDGITLTDTAFSADFTNADTTKAVANKKYVDDSVTGFVTLSEVQDEIDDRVTASSTGTSTNEVSYLTVGDTEYKLAGGSGGSYTAGNGIDITNNTISVDDDVVVTRQTVTQNSAYIQQADNSITMAPAGTMQNASAVPESQSYVAMGLNDHYFCGTPTANRMTANKEYVDTQVGTKSSVSETHTGSYFTAMSVDGTLKSFHQVSGANDGENWTSITIDDESYNIPSGGSGSAYTVTGGLLTYVDEQEPTVTYLTDVYGGQGTKYTDWFGDTDRTPNIYFYFSYNSETGKWNGTYSDASLFEQAVNGEHIINAIFLTNSFSTREVWEFADCNIAHTSSDTYVISTEVGISFTMTKNNTYPAYPYYDVVATIPSSLIDPETYSNAYIAFGNNGFIGSNQKITANFIPTSDIIDDATIKVDDSKLKTAVGGSLTTVNEALVKTNMVRKPADPHYCWLADYMDTFITYFNTLDINDEFKITINNVDTLWMVDSSIRAHNEEDITLPSGETIGSGSCYLYIESGTNVSFYSNTAGWQDTSYSIVTAYTDIENIEPLDGSYLPIDNATIKLNSSHNIETELGGYTSSVVTPSLNNITITKRASVTSQPYYCDLTASDVETLWNFGNQLSLNDKTKVIINGFEYKFYVSEITSNRITLKPTCMYMAVSSTETWNASSIQLVAYNNSGVYTGWLTNLITDFAADSYTLTTAYETVSTLHPINGDYIATPPTTAGTYSLKCVVDAEGNRTYSWVADT